MVCCEWAVPVVLLVVSSLHSLQSDQEKLQFVEDVDLLNQMTYMLLELLGPRSVLMPMHLALESFAELNRAGAAVSEDIAREKLRQQFTSNESTWVGKRPLKILRSMPVPPQFCKDLSKVIPLARKFSIGLNGDAQEFVIEFCCFLTDTLDYLSAFNLEDL